MAVIAGTPEETNFSSFSQDFPHIHLVLLSLSSFPFNYSALPTSHTDNLSILSHGQDYGGTSHHQRGPYQSLACIGEHRQPHPPPL